MREHVGPRPSKFIQIATCGAENGHSLYALDDEGQLWEYASRPRSDAPFSTDWFWQPLETERRAASPAGVSEKKP